MRTRLVMLTLILAVSASLVPAPALAATSGYSTASIRATIAQETRRAGFAAPADTRAAITLAYRESSWRPTARNDSCLGLFQLSRAMCTGFDWRDPRLNTRRAMRYIRGRYGTPRRALAHSYRHGWY